MDEMNIKECEAAVEAVRKCESEEELGTLLWNVVELNAGSTFYTSKKLPFTYRVKGRELFCDRKEKSITQATVLRAYKKIREAREAGEPIRGPKKLSMFGAPYIWGIPEGNRPCRGRGGNGKKGRVRSGGNAGEKRRGIVNGCYISAENMFRTVSISQSPRGCV